MDKKWLEIKNKADVTEIYINGDIVSDSDNDGFYEFFDLNNPNVYPLDVVNALKEAGEVHVHINSYGGDVFAGLAISNMLKNHKAKTVAYVDGLSASSASIIAFGCNEIVIPSNAYLMIHRVSCGLFGNADDFLKQVEVMEKIEEGIVDTYMEKAVEGITKEQIYDLMKAETWFTGKDCLNYFNVKVSDSPIYLNKVDTKQKYNHIPDAIKNSVKDSERLEKMKKEIELEVF
jgi:clpP protease family protein